MAKKRARKRLYGSGGSHQITLTLKNKNSLVNGNLSVSGRLVGVSIKLRVIRLVLFQHIVDGGQKHSGNCDDGFFVAAPLFETEVADANFRVAFGADGGKGALNEQRLDISSGPADSGRFLLPRALIVLRRKTGPRAKMFRGREHGHIHADFRDNANRGIGLDTRRRHDNVDLREILLSDRQNQGFQTGFAEVQIVHVGTDDAELFSLFDTHFSVHSGQDFLVSGFHSFGTESCHVRNRLGWIFQNAGCNCGSGLAKHIGENAVQLDVGNGEAILGAVLFASIEIREFLTVTNQIPKLANVCGRNKTAGHQIMLENVGNPFGVFLVGFLPANRLDVFRMGEDNVAGCLQNIRPVR